jgi:hypothetical protein
MIATRKVIIEKYQEMDAYYENTLIASLSVNGEILNPLHCFNVDGKQYATNNQYVSNLNYISEWKLEDKSFRFIKHE